jgi:hypothetical protein
MSPYWLAGGFVLLLLLILWEDARRGRREQESRDRLLRELEARFAREQKPNLRLIQGGK